MRDVDPVVVVPVYRLDLSREESASFRRLISVLGGHRVALAMPDRLRSKPVGEFVRDHGGSSTKVDALWFDDARFQSVRTYNRWLLEDEFYRRLEPHTHVLVYQLDAWVFEDRLEEFCRLDYDFLGAPWFTGLTRARRGQAFLGTVGNGGFSLRRIEAFRKTLEEPLRRARIESLPEMSARLRLQHRGLKRIASIALSPLSFAFRNTLVSTGFPSQLQEDMFWGLYSMRLNPAFRTAPPTVGVDFAWECNPRWLHELRNGKLPFGCHAWARYDPEFWRSFILP